MKLIYKSVLVALMCGLVTVSASATRVTVTMNTVSKTMSLTAKKSGSTVAVGDPDTSNKYTFDTEPGIYTLTAYGNDGTTINGTIDLTVNDTDAQAFDIVTGTMYVTNKTDGRAWTLANGDYTLDVEVTSREGEAYNITIGNSVTTGRNTFVAILGSRSMTRFIPSSAHKAEGYITLSKFNSLSANATINGAIPMSGRFTATTPADADLELAVKFAHFIDMSLVEPADVKTVNGHKEYTYSLANNQMYFFRTWRSGGLTNSGYFTMSTDETARPTLAFTDEDYDVMSPDAVIHDASHNNGLETGDIMLNINGEGHLRLNIGDTFTAHAMRSWQLTNNYTANNFVEPDFHYTVTDLNGQPSNSVITVEQSARPSAWATLKAVGAGTAIVTVSYDAMATYYYNKDVKTPFVGGQNWSACWPENTAVYVVTVGQPVSAATSEMTLNVGYNSPETKQSADNPDAEHDVFYYLDSEPGAYYTFYPSRTSAVDIARPSFSASKAYYTGFTTDGVTANADGSYTVLLSKGRSIVRLTDASGNATYQVLTAKPCTMTVTNLTSGKDTCRPGDRLSVQFAGLFHPANKLAGVYNMSARVQYNDPSLSEGDTGSQAQYNFGNSAPAQSITVTVPADLDVKAHREYVVTGGCLNVNGFGDPFGNHRIIDPVAGRSPNFKAISHNAMLGRLPDICVTIDPDLSVQDINSDDNTLTIESYYNLQGIASPTPYRGLNIIKYTNGTHAKVYLP